MDLETENRIAAILMKEAAELRRQAEKEGVHVYLQKPNSRVRPNPRFLAATVLGVQQSNRAVEVNEMWRIRKKEMEMDDRRKSKSNDWQSFRRSYRDGSFQESPSKRHGVADESTKASCSSSQSGGGLRDEELEEFLHSRAKRGRGSVGSRMDETGPYLPRSPNSNDDLRTSDTLERRTVYGPEKPHSRKRDESSEEETDDDKREKKRKRVHSRSSKKHGSKSKSKDKKKKRKEEKRSKHKKS